MPTTTTDTPNDTGYASDEELSVTAQLESNRVLQKIRDKTDAVVERIQPKIAAVSDYARNEPTKAVLIAAATGAGLMALLALLARSSRPTPSEHRPAHHVGDPRRRPRPGRPRPQRRHPGDRHRPQARQQRRRHRRAPGGRGQARLEAMQKRANDVADSVAETWASLREQAAPVVDKLKPQLDALATYAKEDPTRAALGVATAGAMLIGLLSLLRR